MTSHKPLDFKNLIEGDQWKVWVPFHFLPGSTGSKFVKLMTCQMNSKPAQKMLEYALSQKSEKWGHYAIGVAMHVFADTFSHQGFVGYHTHWNKVVQKSIKFNLKSKTIEKYVKRKMELFEAKLLGSVAENVELGHAAVATLPDRPYLKWSYKCEEDKSKTINRDNQTDFHKAARLIHTFLICYAEEIGQATAPTPWSDISTKVLKLIKIEGTKEHRSKKWRDAIGSDEFFKSTKKDENVKYDIKRWRPTHLDFLLDEEPEAGDCELSLFYKAAWKHRHFVLRELLPDLGLLE